MSLNRKRNGPTLQSSGKRLAKRTATLAKNTEKKFILGIDFGTTFTSVSYFSHPINEQYPRAAPSELRSITNWPDDLACSESNGTRPQVPTETNQQYKENISRDPKSRVKRSKLRLVQTPYTLDDRVELLEIIEGLIHDKLIRKHGSKYSPDTRDVLDIFTDFLVKVLQHTKKQLIQLNNFSDGSVVEFALTVPTIWSPNASRILQTALQTAARAVKFGDTSDAIVPYIVSEPEAAATYMLAGTNSVHLGETFIIADCGGGTCDIVTYEIGTKHPLRLSEEKVTPGGDNCGGSYLNENYKQMLLDRLQDETYLLDNLPAGESLESIVNRFIPTFENDFKRRKDVTASFSLKTRLYLPGLKHSAEKRQDWEEVFNPLLERVKNLLQAQLSATFQKGLKVKAITTTMVTLDIREFNLMIADIRAWQLTRALDRVTAVSCSAVLATLNKANGPARMAESSYGFFRREPYQLSFTHGFEGHRDSTFQRDRERCPVDGEEYVHVINYFVTKLEIFAELNGMLLEYYATYFTETGSTTASKGQVCVAAAFAPGCA
ncbi:hypothetical protein SBOR_4757 [Sclerotinia borealis F-4128]|uniref:Hsp70 family protein n=1 Tax=Sclerotinia borealis (strain F-4128) TaxID=1432307 RepID=W9CGA5_SCLBF|nr:hypothetical protein SBOR_4757 [Sclerotinia borealis F-4128]